jgi:hypothetical protein
MAAYMAQDMADLVAGTLRELGPMRFQQVAQNYQEYEVFPKWFRKDKVSFDTGIGIQRTLMTKIDQNAARHVAFNEPDSTSIIDVLDNIQVNWVHAVTSWGLTYQTDILMNRGKALILNVLKPRRAAALIGLVEQLEEKAFGTAPATTDKKNPWGVKYWVVQNATTGFNGGYPGSHTNLAGIDLTDATGFKNYTGRYVDVNKQDLIKKMRTAHRKVRFRSPVSIRDYRSGLRDRYRVYTNETVMSAIEDVGEAQNDNLGRDIASMDGQMYFRNHPIIWIPYLDGEADDPVYMLDMSTFYPVCLAGDYLRESPPMVNANNHNLYEVHVDLTYNYLCVDRRRNAVFDTAG